jgi:hypothetical protein
MKACNVTSPLSHQPDRSHPAFLINQEIPAAALTRESG